MAIRVLCGDLFDADAAAILLTADLRGTAASLSGANLAAAFRRRWPEAWEDVEADVLTEREARGLASIAPGDVLVANVSECPFAYVFIANSLPHVGPQSDKPASVARSIEQALALARQREVDVVAAPVMVGGWRLGPEDALDAMVAGLRRASARHAPNPLGVDLAIYNREAEVCERLRARVAKLHGGTGR